MTTQEHPTMRLHTFTGASGIRARCAARADAAERTSYDCEQCITPHAHRALLAMMTEDLCAARPAPAALPRMRA